MSNVSKKKTLFVDRIWVILVGAAVVAINQIQSISQATLQLATNICIQYVDGSWSDAPSIDSIALIDVDNSLGLPDNNRAAHDTYFHRRCCELFCYREHSN